MPTPLRRIELTEEQRAELQSRRRSRTIKHADALRARIILLAADGVKSAEIAERVGVSRRNVYKWVWRFDEEGLDGLADKPRSGRPSTVDSDTVDEVLQKTLTQIPAGCTHWSLRLMAKAVGIQPRQVHEIWKSAGLKPHRTETFKVSRDPEFADKLVDIIGLYMNPPDNALVLSVDEKTQIQALDRTQPLLPLRKGQVERRTHDYKRNGTVNLYAALNTKTGKVSTRLEKKHRAKEFIKFLDQLDREHRTAPAIHVILDNSSTHSTPEVKAWLKAHPQFTFHFTPTSASWLNAVETWFSSLERRAVRRGVFCSVLDLRRAIHAYVNAYNSEYAKPFVWKNKADVILAKVERARERLGL